MRTIPVQVHPASAVNVPVMIETLFIAMLRAGVPCRSELADLHVPCNRLTRAILSRFPTQEKNAREFVQQPDPAEKANRVWLVIPLAYDPWFQRSK